MTLNEAYELIDLLLDKADQPYFTVVEKDKFLNLAISDFINMHYQKMTADEDSRRALSGCIDYLNFTLTENDIVSGSYIYNNSYPALSVKYEETYSAYSNPSPELANRVGYFITTNQYVLPKQHLYVLSLAIQTYNKEKIIDPSTGEVYDNVDESHVVYNDKISVKNKSVRDFYEDMHNDDPFNKSNINSPQWCYLENRILIHGATNAIRHVEIQVITLPTVEQAFSVDTYGAFGSASTAPAMLVFTDHYQKQIIQIAVKRMTQTDIGLMTQS